MREMISQYGTMLLSVAGAGVAIGMAFMTLQMCKPLLQGFLAVMM